MRRKQSQFKAPNFNQDRYSNFVVDLRSKLKTPPAQPVATKPEKVQFFSGVKKFSLRFRSPKKSWQLKTGLEFPEEQEQGSRFARFISVLPGNFSVRFRSKRGHVLAPLAGLLKQNRQTKFSWQLFSNHSSKSWQAKVLEQQKILSARFRPGQRRLQAAESKAAWYRSLLSFMIVLLLLLVPLKLLSYFEFLDLGALEEKVMVQSKASINQLLLAVDSVSALEFQEASAAFSEASEGFLSAREDLSFVSDSLLALASLSNDPKIKLAAESKKFLAAGAVSAALGRNLVLAMNSLFNQQSSDSFLTALDDFAFYGDLAVKDAAQLDKIISSINAANLPAEYRGQFNALASQSQKIKSSLASFVASSLQAKELLGLSRDKRYLLIFQNNSELRASGGFLGSYALIDIRDGKIKNLEVPAGGSYDTEGGMQVKVKAPEPLWLVNPSWHFWDANWWPDWPTTAQNLMWFYGKSGGPTVDGVISLTPTVVERLLEITGPIDLTEEYGLIIDSENFWETTQKVVEHKNLLQSNPDEVAVFKESQDMIVSSIPLEQDLENNPDNKPKKIIGDLMAKILEVLPEKLDKDNLVKIISLFEASLAEKQILFYFVDPVLQAEASKRNWAGETKSAPHDYLMVVNTNIAGQKSDRKMEEKIEHISRVNNNGQIINTVKIFRGHTGIKNEALTGVRNVNWLRVYVPGGSRLLSASGLIPPDQSYFEYPEEEWLESQFLEAEKLAVTDPASGFKVYQEKDKTVFAGWVMTDPGQTAEITLVYELPVDFFHKSESAGLLTRLNQLLNPEMRASWPYSLLVQKQPGARPSSFSSRLELSEPLDVSWRHPASLPWQQGWRIDTELNADKYFSVLLKR